MQPLSATECISPAIDRTKLVLFSPFRKGRTWKLCATAYVCRYGTMFFPFPLIYLVYLPAARATGSRLAVIALLSVVALATLFFLWIYYLCSRLQFAYFDIVVHRGEYAAPAWRKYPQSLPWTGFKLLFGIAAGMVGAVPLLAYIRHILPVLHTLSHLAPGRPMPPQAVASLFAGYGILILIFAPFFLISSLMADFIVPSLALEDTGLKEAFRRMAELIRREPGQFALYTLLKIVLAITFYFAAFLAWEIAFILVSIVLALVVVLIGFLLHFVGVPTLILTILGILIAAAWYSFAAIYAMMLTIGPVLTFLDAYGLYFLGGRYPMLGDLLDRSTPPAPPNPYLQPYPPGPYAQPYPPYPGPPPQ